MKVFFLIQQWLDLQTSRTTKSCWTISTPWSLDLFVVTLIFFLHMNTDVLLVAEISSIFMYLSLKMVTLGSLTCWPPERSSWGIPWLHRFYCLRTHLNMFQFFWKKSRWSLRPKVLCRNVLKLLQFKFKDEDSEFKDVCRSDLFSKILLIKKK